MFFLVSFFYFSYLSAFINNLFSFECTLTPCIACITYAESWPEQTTLCCFLRYVVHTRSGHHYYHGKHCGQRWFSGSLAAAGAVCRCFAGEEQLTQMAVDSSNYSSRLMKIIIVNPVLRPSDSDAWLLSVSLQPVKFSLTISTRKNDN